MKERFGVFVFTSSIAYIMAKAIATIADNPKRNGDDDIGLWGIMQASETEYAYQKPGIQQLFQIAHDHGINTTIPQISKLFTPPPDIW